MGTSSIQVDVDETLRADAQQVLAAEGLTISDAFSMLLETVVHDRSLPIVFRKPNAETLAAMREIESGHLQSASTVEEFMRMMHEDD